LFFGITAGQAPDRYGWLTHVRSPAGPARSGGPVKAERS
jgi:hypothetical protein